LDGVIFLDYYPKNLKDEGMSEEKMMEIVEDVCLGLLFLNEEQVIHRDLKESNIMIDKSNRGRIIDFGSAFSTFGSVKFKPKDTKRTNKPTQFDQHQDITYPTKVSHPHWRLNLVTKSSILTAFSTSIVFLGY
jgi:serine/threonine protein kinase